MTRHFPGSVHRSLVAVGLVFWLTGCFGELDVDDVPDVGDSYETDETDAGKTDFGGSWPVLREGDINRSVVAAQFLLRERGEELSVDGEFGPGTVSATRSFQDRAGLTVDGRIGGDTWQALIADVPLAHGDSGSAVRAVQYLLLNRYRYSIGVTGEYGPTTEERLRAFQRDRCIEVDGVVGEETWFALIAGSPCGGGGAYALLRAHMDGRMILAGPGDAGSSAYDNIADTVAGRPALRSARGHFGATRVYLRSAMLDGMVHLLDRFGHYHVTSIAGGRHGAGSHHYHGDAVDIGALRGDLVRGDTAAAREMMRLCVALGAREVIGPSWQVPGARSDANHQTHIHCADWR